MLRPCRCHYVVLALPMMVMTPRREHSLLNAAFAQLFDAEIFPVVIRFTRGHIFEIIDENTKHRPHISESEPGRRPDSAFPDEETLFAV
ncbi:hypothetical protein RB195_012503 [Necator americanus]|uniref:Uncharacterized protein n=1 Tax=Necator americanus TaxID=51031 RepID=A0ABR1D8B5_NECAM